MNFDGKKYTTDSFEKTVGACVRRARRAARLTMAAVAYEMNISQPYLSKLELGNATWSGELIAKACNALDISAADVFRCVETDEFKLFEVALKQQQLRYIHDETVREVNGTINRKFLQFYDEL